MKVSIIVPIYNVEKYIKKCIDSLLNQTFSEILIYAISDGSQDRSIEILKEYSDERLLIFEKKNGGYGSVLEYAIKKITTKYFLICDPDDWLERDAIEKLYNSAELLKTDLTMANYVLQYLDGVAKKQQIFSKSHQLTSNKRYTDLNNFAFVTWSPHSKLYVTEFAKNINFPDKVSYTDTLLYFVYLSRIESAAYVDEYLSNYLVNRPGNTVGEIFSYSKKTFTSQLLVYDYTIKELSYSSKHIGTILSRLLMFLVEIAKHSETIADLRDKELMNNEIIVRIKLLRPYASEIIKSFDVSYNLKQVLRKIYIKLLLDIPKFMLLISK